MRRPARARPGAIAPAVEEEWRVRGRGLARWMARGGAITVRAVHLWREGARAPESPTAALGAVWI
jgi:hypothetical protein